jgi:hypothetical protein
MRITPLCGATTHWKGVDDIQRFSLSIIGILAVLFAVLVPTGALGADLDLRSETLLRALERDTTEGEDRFVLPIYEYLRIDYQNLEEGGLSIHLYGWGRKDLAESDYFDEDGDGELLYGYLAYARPYGSFSARLGRQHIFAGVTNETVDGLKMAADLGSHFSVSGFAGLPAAYSEENGSGGDTLYGGRLAHHLGRAYQIGASYSKITDDGEDIAETTGVDLTADLTTHLSLNGLSAYNVDTQVWREHRYDAVLRMGALHLSPRYHQFEFQDYFGSSSSDGDPPEAGSPFRFLGETDETLTLYGTDAEVPLGARLILGAKVTKYHYDQRDEDALYAAALVTLDRNSEFELGAEVGQMRGDSDDNRYWLYRSYLYWQLGTKILTETFISADAQLVDYEAEIYGKSQAQFYSLGVGGDVVPGLITLNLALNYARDPYYDEDVSAILSLLLAL